MTEETLKVIISAEIGKLKEELKKGKEEVEDFHKKSNTAFKDFADVANSAGEKAKTALVGFGVTVTALAGSLLALTASTEEYRVGQAKLLSAFETAGASAETAKETYNDLYRVLGDSDVAVEAANHLSQMTTSQQALSEWTTICQGVYATFGDSLPIEGLTEAANETAKVGTITGVLADSLSWAGVCESEFQAKLDACNTEAEREALIRQTLTGLYTDAASAYETNAAEILAQHEAEAKLAESTAQLGEALAPVNTMLTELATEVLTALAPHIESFMNEHGEALKSLLIGIGEAIGAVISWLADNWGIISRVATVLGIIMGAVYALSFAIDVYTLAQTLANAQMLIVYGAIVAIIAVIAVLVVYWDDIKEAMGKCAEAIKKAWANMGEWFSNIAEQIKRGFKDIGGWFKNLFTSAATGIKNAFSSIGAWFGNVASSIKNVFSGIGGWFTQQFTTAANGIKNAFSGITGFFQNIFNSIGSVFTNIGNKIAEGLVSGVKKAVNAVLKAAVTVVNAAIAAINGAIGLINLIPGVNIGRIQELSVPKLAKGGIVDDATLAVVGESGKEAVVPLENNLGWLDKLAGMLNDRMGGNAPIVMQVDGKTFAEVSVNSINQLTKQRGTLPLTLA